MMENMNTFDWFAETLKNERQYQFLTEEEAKKIGGVLRNSKDEKEIVAAKNRLRDAYMRKAFSIFLQNTRSMSANKKEDIFTEYMLFYSMLAEGFDFKKWDRIKLEEKVGEEKKEVPYDWNVGVAFLLYCQKQLFFRLIGLKKELYGSDNSFGLKDGGTADCQQKQDYIPFSSDYKKVLYLISRVESICMVVNANTEKLRKAMSVDEQERLTVRIFNLAVFERNFCDRNNTQEVPDIYSKCFFESEFSLKTVFDLAGFQKNVTQDLIDDYKEANKMAFISYCQQKIHRKPTDEELTSYLEALPLRDADITKTALSLKHYRYYIKMSYEMNVSSLDTPTNDEGEEDGSLKDFVPDPDHFLNKLEREATLDSYLAAWKEQGLEDLQIEILKRRIINFEAYEMIADELQIDTIIIQRLLVNAFFKAIDKEVDI